MGQNDPPRSFFLFFFSNKISLFLNKYTINNEYIYLKNILKNFYGGDLSEVSDAKKEENA